MAGTGIKLPSVKIKCAAYIANKKNAIGAAGAAEGGIDLHLELSPDKGTPNLIGELMEKRGCELYITIKVIDSKSNGILMKLQNES